MPASPETARRRLRKFLDRANDELGEPIVALRDENGDIPALTLHWISLDGQDWGLSAINHPELTKRMLDSVIVECRPFFAAREDCYLPRVVTDLQSLHTPDRARARRPLRDHVAQVVRDSNIGANGPVFYSGRLEEDNGLGPGKLLPSNLIAMDYIYGRALHEDDERIARLQNVDEGSQIKATLYHLNDLLYIVANVKRQVVHDLEAGYIDLES